MKELSIIIPVYNVQDYLSRCLDSCIQQDISPDDYEIIIVNDGSTDNSLNIAQRYSKKFNNIAIVTQVNKGLSSARNTGLEAANGKYVWFIDSDDWIETNIVKNLLSIVSLNRLDVLCFNLRLVDENNATTPYHISIPEKFDIYSGEEFITKIKVAPAAWAAIFRREFLLENQLLFYEGILHEDMEFTPRAYSLARRISVVSIAVYNYFQRSGSIMKSANFHKKSKDLLIVAESLYSFAETHFDKKSPAYDCIMEKVAFAFTQSLAYFQPKQTSIKQYTASPCYPLTIPGTLSVSDKFKYLLANISINLYLTTYRSFKRLIP